MCHKDILNRSHRVNIGKLNSCHWYNHFNYYKDILNCPDHTEADTGTVFSVLTVHPHTMMGSSHLSLRTVNTNREIVLKTKNRNCKWLQF